MVIKILLPDSEEWDWANNQEKMIIAKTAIITKM